MFVKKLSINILTLYEMFYKGLRRGILIFYANTFKLLTSKHMRLQKGDSNMQFQLQFITDELPQTPVHINQRTAVRGVIHYQNKILMVQTNRGDYKFPGGGMEEGETEKETLLREITEETGYTDIHIGVKIGETFEQNIDTEDPESYFQMKSCYYECWLMSDKRAPGVQDDYEEKLGFHGTFVTVEEAYQSNLSLLKREQKKMHDFLQKAFTVIFIATIVVWFLQSFDLHLNMVSDSAHGILAVVSGAIAPLFAPLGLGDWRFCTALICGVMAKESVVSTLEVLFGGSITAALSPLAAACLLVFSLLYTPCVAAIASIKRELGTRWAVAVVVWQCALAWVAASIVHLVGLLLGGGL